MNEETLLLAALKRNPTPRPPVWLMRQAGRYMAEYRAVRQKISFLDLCRNPSLCADVMAEAVAWAARNGGDTARLGLTGFCWGGRITWLYAAHSPQVRAGVAWYGRLVGNASALQPRHPVDLAGELKAPVLGLYGAADTGIALDTVERMKAVLAAGSPAAQRSEFVVYPEAPHAFHADYRPSFRAGPAADGWARCLAWFKAQGVA